MSTRKPTVQQPKYRNEKGKRAFIGAYIETCSITKACEAVGIARSVHYTWLAEDPLYRDDFFASKPQVAERLEDEAVRRGFEGIPKPITVAGEREVIMEYDSSLLRDLLRAHAPNRFRDRQSVEINWGTFDATKLTEAQLMSLLAAAEERVKALAAQARQIEAPAGETIDVTVREQSSDDGSVAD